MKVSATAYDRTVTIEVDREDLEIAEVLDLFEVILAGLGYSVKGFLCIEENEDA